MTGRAANGRLLPSLQARARSFARSLAHHLALARFARSHPAETTLPRLDLALVIPVWNDAAGLARLMVQVRALGCFAQIVVVDDGSDPPVPPAPDITLLRHASPQGGGVARNAGLARVTTRHVLFFDADDLLTDELPLLLADLADTPEAFDFCLFKHADSRIAAENRWGQPDWDEAFWASAGLGTGALREAPAAALPLLAQTANYPWNKIYRVDFLRAHGIGCADTRVHQDIPLHWLGFMAARRVLVSDRICAWHQITPAGVAGTRLTDRKGAERLEVFRALAPAAEAAGRAADPAWRLALTAFVLGLIDWVEGQLDPALHPALRAAEASWLASITTPWLAEIDAADAGLAARLRARMGQG